MKFGFVFLEYTKMKPLNYRDLVKVLKKYGFVLSRKRGSHMI